VSQREDVHTEQRPKFPPARALGSAFVRLRCRGLVGVGTVVRSDVGVALPVAVRVCFWCADFDETASVGGGVAQRESVQTGKGPNATQQEVAHVKSGWSGRGSDGTVTAQDTEPLTLNTV